MTQPHCLIEQVLPATAEAEGNRRPYRSHRFQAYPLPATRPTTGVQVEKKMGGLRAFT